MHISTEIVSFRKYGGDRSVLKLLKDAGFDAYDYSMFYESNAFRLLLSEDYIEQAKAFRTYADELGLTCNQAHAPFPTAGQCYGMDARKYRDYARKYIKRAIEVAGILGAKVIVVHPVNDYSAAENMEVYRDFEAVARKAGVKIGVENMWNWKQGAPTACAAACSSHEDFKKHLDLLPSDVFVACVDIGHAEMAGLQTSAAETIRTLGERVEALHIHDNDRLHDSHALPYLGNIDFDAVIDALRAVGYRGDVTLEANAFVERFPLELYPQAAELMAAVADTIRKKLEKVL